MRLLIALFVFLVAVLGAGYWLNDPGYVLVRLGDIAAETTLWGGFLMLTCAVVVLRLIYVTLRGFLRGSSWLLGWSSQRKTKGLQAHTKKAAIALVQGKWLLAQQHFIKAQKLGDIGFAGNLGLARAAYELGHKDVQVNALASAKALSPDNSHSISNLAMAWQVAQGESEEVIEILEPLQAAGGCTHQMHIVLAQAYICQRRWLDLKALWPSLETQKLLKKELFDKDFEQLWAGRLLAEASIVDALKILPKALKSDTAMLTQWVDLLLLEDKEDEAVTVIEVALATHWDEQLVQRYGTTLGSDIDAQLVQAKKWLKKNANDPCLLMTLGHLANAKRQVSSARDYFENALAQTAESDPVRSEIYRELGRTCHSLGDSQRALQYLLKA